MIIVKNRELLIPNHERYIGTTYDNESEMRLFQIPRFSQNGVDLSALTFRLDLKYANNATDTVILSKEVTDLFIYATWEITNSQLQVPGTVYIGIRAADDEATVKWTSFTAAIYVDRHLNTPGNYTGDLTEIEQMEQDHQYMMSVVDELRENLDYRQDAEAYAVGTRLGEDVPETDDTYHNNSKYYKEVSDQNRQTAEAYAKGTVDGVAVESGDTGYHDNSKYYSELAAASEQTATDTADAIVASRNQISTNATNIAAQTARIDNIVALTQGSTTGDAELQDIRVAHDGTTYTSAGTSVRAQIGDLKSQIDDISERTRNLFYGGFVNGNIDSAGAEYAQTNFLRCVEFIPVSASSDYTLHVWTTSAFTQIVLVEYKSDKTVATRRGIVSSSAQMTERVQTFTTGSTTAYIRFVLYSANDISPNGNRTQIESGSTATAYIGYNITAIDRFVRSKFDTNEQLDGSYIADDSVFITKTKGIFDYDYQFIYFADVVTGLYYADNGSVSNASTSAIVPYPIKVKANKTYNYRGLYNRHCLFVDSNNNITFFSNTDTYVDGSITPATNGYVLISIPYDSGTGIKDTAMFCDGELPSARVEGGYNVVVINSDETPKNTVLTVSTDGTKDFTSVKAAIDAITDANEFHTYTIQIYEGTYDIKSYYSAEQWAVESTAFIGLIVPNYVTLEGIGSRDSIILTATDSTARNYISTLNLSEVCSLKNITVKSNGLRYAVHDDYSTNSNKGLRTIENCVFEQQNGFYVQAYGAGFHDNDAVIMRNCICKTDEADGYSISFHNNTDFAKGSYLEFDNCRFGQAGLNLITIADGVDNNVVLKGTKAQSLVLNRQTSDTGIAFKVSGYANDVTNVSVSIGTVSDYVDLI